MSSVSTGSSYGSMVTEEEESKGETSMVVRVAEDKYTVQSATRPWRCIFGAYASGRLDANFGRAARYSVPSWSLHLPSTATNLHALQAL